jgi:hypothetical protein
MRQRWVGFSAAATAAVSFAVLWIPNLDSRVAAGATGAAYLTIGLLLAGILAVATISQRGILMAGAAFLVAVGPWGPEFFLQIMFFAYAVWLMVLVSRQTRGTGAESGRFAAFFSGIKGRLVPAPAPATSAGRARPASSARYTAPQRRRR